MEYVAKFFLIILFLVIWTIFIGGIGSLLDFSFEDIGSWWFWVLTIVFLFGFVVIVSLPRIIKHIKEGGSIVPHPRKIIAMILILGIGSCGFLFIYDSGFDPQTFFCVTPIMLFLIVSILIGVLIDTIIGKID